MCGDLVSNHGTTGRASIERAEARPSYPIPSPFAWSHVGGTSGTGGTGANQPNPMLLSHALSYSSSRKSLSFHLLLSLPFSLSSSLSLSLSFSLYFGSLLLCSTLFLCLSFVCTSTSQPTASATHSERPHPHPPPTTPNQPAATSSADAHILLPLRCRPHFPQQSPT